MWSREFNRFRRGISLCITLLVIFPPLASAKVSAQTSLEKAVAGLEWREIGPATPGGRIADLAVDDGALMFNPVDADRSDVLSILEKAWSL